MAYRKGISLYLADTLSQAPLSMPVKAKVTGFEVFRVDLEKEERNPQLKLSTEAKLQEHTNTDDTLQKLVAVIVQGWPSDKHNEDNDIWPYWNFRDELTVLNGVIYKGLQVLVPPSMQTEMLKKIHINHFGT